MQDKDEAHIYAAGGNEYIYETIAEASVKVSYLASKFYIISYILYDGVWM